MKYIPDTSECYSITNEGVVWRVKGNKNQKGQIPPHVISPSDNGGGYKYVGVKGKNHYIHRLVAKLFIPNPDNHNYVGHKDHNKSNNVVDNLYWTDASSNTRHGVRDGKINYKGRLNGKMKGHSDWLVTCAYYDVKVHGDNIQDVATRYGINRATLSSWINKRSRQELTDRLDSEK